MSDEMDDDMSDDSHSTYSSWYSRRSPAYSPPKPDPITHYDIRYLPSDGMRTGKCIDLAFILDCTGSMQRYIDSVRDHIIGICDMIRGEEGLNGPDDLRVAVVNYRDHPPQDSSYVYQFHPFTSDIPSVQRYIRGLTASGGGDGPEAVTAGMAAVLTELEWRREASKMVVLIADAPPHGIGESGDQIKVGDPDGHDPLVIARYMAQHGITLFMVACEDTLSNYHHAVDFFTAICNMTSGLMLPLTTADLLAMTIVGSVLENMDMERLIEEVGAEVAQRVRMRGETMESVEQVAQELHERLLLRNEQTKQVSLPEVYVPHENAKKNVSTWMSAQYVSDAVPNILDVPGKRLTDKFRSNAFHHFSYTPGGRLPPRRVSASHAPPTPSSPTHPLKPMSPPMSPPTASPSRRVVSDFKPFGAASSGSTPLSVFGAPVLATGPGGGMFGSAGTSSFGGMRNREEEEEDEDDGKEARLKMESISLDQARRIATQSVFRASRLG
ncbi:hypothetical protein TREMEDRAFT_64216 [Tremella mesenterica DSM 1558]|uniref:uncharacterized protein n=1 Tax=Tremella mesenterica (strain ATCC 24925 / CBS 8224 / DSM 1558 / NBRC 9311 / NRRL Y-6157 / RJB 2259-6 / UBC 559-6) TaxID=578456 RepID=UPI0003F49535|nr:uncharacterized protein TREMEDRAFT_64216 [Tremella mesenterica DSM 1558]EIW67625.1 hypothetical protein TREMEDRAFT_64216 [Tremella mesenterica DSM 1558]